jgi:hypothetical protein
MTIKTEFKIPIFDVRVWLVVSPKIYEARRRMNGLLGPAPKDDDWTGLCSSAWPAFGLFFHEQLLSENIVAHEVYHLTRSIVSGAGVRNEETEALLHGYLTDLFRKELFC